MMHLVDPVLDDGCDLPEHMVIAHRRQQLLIAAEEKHAAGVMPVVCHGKTDALGGHAFSVKEWDLPLYCRQRPEFAQGRIPFQPQALGLTAMPYLVFIGDSRQRFPHITDAEGRILLPEKQDQQILQAKPLLQPPT